jgi:LysR family glycine cleavage system transcriptional activator
LVALRAFEAAARHLSFTTTASELNVTQGAVSRQIKSLEEYLGVQLFQRLPRKLQLTPEGAAYSPVLREALDIIERATNRLVNRNREHVLTLSVLPTFAMAWIIPRLANFNMRYPSIEVHLVTSIEPADFTTDIDVAIRVGTRRAEPTKSASARIDLVMVRDWSGLVAEFLMPDIIIPVCCPRLAAGPPPLQQPADLRNFALLHNSTRPHAWADWLDSAGVRDIDPLEGPTYSHFFMVIQAASQGQGVACVPSVLVDSDLQSGRLVQLFEQRVESGGAYYLLYREHDSDSGKIRAFRDWLKEEINVAPTAPTLRPNGPRAFSHVA